MKTKCYSVRVESVTPISDKASLIRTFDGREDVFPNSQIFGYDMEVHKSEAIWIAAWVLERKNIQYSTKKVGWYNHTTHRMEKPVTVVTERHVPEAIQAKPTNPDDSLIR